MTRRRLRRSQGEPAPDTQSPDVLAQADEQDRRIVERALPHTMTSPARMLGVVDAVRYCTARAIPGAFAECGVWRGGSVLAMLLTLQDVGVDDREIYLYDTFEGMTAPTPEDVSDLEGAARDVWDHAAKESQRPWHDVFGPEAFDEESVRSTLRSTGYPVDRLHFVTGPVEGTIPGTVPEELALLRLDTDWYESTRHELVHLFPLLRAGGVLIIDDYGHWRGARQAVDEYFSSVHRPVLLSRLDYTGRIAVKV